MSRRPPPARTIGPLEQLLDRLATESAALVHDPDLPRRVEHAIHARMAARPRARGGLPAWMAIAAAVLVALGVGAGGAAGRRGACGSAHAGPIEARARWEQAKSTKDAPWWQRVEALRAVLDEALPTDSLHRRALKALASACRKAELPHAAAAYEARAAGLGPRSDRGRLGSTLDHARALRREGDPWAAASFLEQVAARGRRIAPWLADRARLDQARDLENARDREGLARLARVTEQEEAAPAVRLQVLDALGLLELADGDERAARRTLEAAERIYRQALRRDDDAANRCAKAWLDLRLRMRLPER